MSKREPAPHEDKVAKIRQLLVDANRHWGCSDDSDMAAISLLGYSLMDAHSDAVMDYIRQAEVLVGELIAVGESAAPAVAKAVRMQGRWRLDLIPYLERFRRDRAIWESLKIVADRTIDPLTPEARRLLKAPSKMPKRPPPHP